MRALALALALAATPAAALSVLPECDPATQSVAHAFRQFDSYANAVVMAVGRLEPGEMFSEVVQSADSSRVYREFHGRFRGKSATAEGFTAAFSAPVTIQQICDGAACVPDFGGGEWLVFLQKTGSGYLFEVTEGTCVPSGFANPSADDLARAIGCLNGGCR